MIRVLVQSKRLINKRIFKEALNDENLELNISYDYEPKCFYDLVISEEISLIKKAYEKNNNSILILIVSHESDVFLYQGINIRYYIRKNNLLDELRIALKDLNKEIGLKNEVVCVKNGLIEYRIRKSNILYIESFKNNIIIHTNNKNYELRETLKRVKDILDMRFIQCHKSYIINMEYISNVDNKIIILNKDIYITLGDKFKKDFCQAYNNQISKTIV